ncbi:MAG TPA: hypothetical protein VJU16_04215, partial [Planctomycetota bacterium]|nr:hypothetical protein [Planctomycetota bacterium]
MPVTAPPGAPFRLDVMAWEAGTHEFHFYVAGADWRDLASLIGPELAGARALILKMPPGLLNPNYWEPLTKEGEAAVRAKGMAVITRE